MLLVLTNEIQRTRGSCQAFTLLAQVVKTGRSFLVTCVKQLNSLPLTFSTKADVEMRYLKLH